MADSEQNQASRKPRDVLLALLLILFWLGLAVVAYFASTNGNIALVTGGHDWKGFICGTPSSEQTSNDQLTNVSLAHNGSLTPSGLPGLSEPSQLFHLDFLSYAFTETSDIPSVCIFS
jgi:hypothetical protein